MRRGARAAALAFLTLALIAGPTRAGQDTALQRYVRAPDAAYAYRPVSTLEGDGYRAHVLEMTSQSWRSPAEVDRTVWKHWVTIVVPRTVRHRTATNPTPVALPRTSDSGDDPDPQRVQELLPLGDDVLRACDRVHAKHDPVRRVRSSTLLPHVHDVDVAVGGHREPRCPVEESAGADQRLHAGGGIDADDLVLGALHVIEDEDVAGGANGKVSRPG